MPCRRHRTRHPTTVYRHGADLSLCYPSMLNVTLEYTTTHFNVLGETRPGNPSPTFHTHQRTLNVMLSWWSTVGSSVESTVPTGSWTRDLWCASPVRYPLAHSDFLLDYVNINIIVLISTPDEGSSLLKGHFSGEKEVASQERFHCMFRSFLTIQPLLKISCLYSAIKLSANLHKTDLFLPILGKSQFFFSWEFSCKLSKFVS